MIDPIADDIDLDLSISIMTSILSSPFLSVRTLRDYVPNKKTLLRSLQIGSIEHRSCLICFKFSLAKNFCGFLVISCSKSRTVGTSGIVLYAVLKNALSSVERLIYSLPDY